MTGYRRLVAGAVGLWLTGGSAAALQVEILQDKLDHPWALAFLPGDRGIVITERSGQLRHWQPQSGLSAPITGVPAVWAQRQGGLLDVALAPDFAQSRRVWLSYTLRGAQGVGAAVGFGRLSEDVRRLEGFTEVLRQAPALSSGANLGTRIAFAPTGHVWVAFGDNFVAENAQRLDTLQGKLVRLNPDGSVPADNPLVGREGARPEIWAWGLRNPQGLAVHPTTGVLWESEHGPRGGDEINRIARGQNYGWPLATWGVDYSGEKVPGSRGGEVAGTVPPVEWWKVSPAISGMAFYQHPRFPQWQNMLFVGALKDRNLIQLRLSGDRVVAQQRLLGARGERIRDVRAGPDGYLYLLTDEANGKLLRVSPEGAAP
ncbi:PQQ-dependent sugar dehydrogenase [Pantoea sp. 1.19]|uniref:PQQ-dependent sugar dehydrogenase n=1 Tax=Pantoea sp. 1.19 TaxID=1925589 RepID=UPI0009491873|nr:PQQ-dependent sugar dehydrogenase [Pantoea sp. 1.19]